MSCPVICLITFLCQTLYLKMVLRLRLIFPSSRVAFPFASAKHLEYQELQVTSLFSVTGLSPATWGMWSQAAGWAVTGMFLSNPLLAHSWHRNSDLRASAMIPSLQQFPHQCHNNVLIHHFWIANRTQPWNAILAALGPVILHNLVSNSVLSLFCLTWLMRISGRTVLNYLLSYYW